MPGKNTVPTTPHVIAWKRLITNRKENLQENRRISFIEIVLIIYKSSKFVYYQS